LNLPYFKFSSTNRDFSRSIEEKKALKFSKFSSRIHHYFPESLIVENCKNKELKTYQEKPLKTQHVVLAWLFF